MSRLAVSDWPTSKANHSLGTSYQLYQHARTNETNPCTVGYAPPSACTRGRPDDVLRLTEYDNEPLLGSLNHLLGPFVQSVSMPRVDNKQTFSPAYVSAYDLFAQLAARGGNLLEPRRRGYGQPPPMYGYQPSTVHGSHLYLQ